MGIPKIIFSPESHHPPHPCISGEIRHHPSAQLVVLFVVVSSFSRVVAISPSTPCLLLDKFTAPEVSQGSKGALRPFFPLPFSSCARARARRLCSAAARHRAASPPPIRLVEVAIAFLASCATSPCKTRVEPSRNRFIAKCRRAPAAVCSPPAPPEPTPAASCKPCETSRAARLPIRRRIVIRWIKSDLTQVNTCQP